MRQTPPFPLDINPHFDQPQCPYVHSDEDCAGFWDVEFVQPYEYVKELSGSAGLKRGGQYSIGIEYSNGSAVRWLTDEDVTYWICQRCDSHLRKLMPEYQHIIQESIHLEVPWVR